MTDTKSRHQMSEVERLTAERNEARTEAMRLRAFIRDVVILEFRELLEFAIVEVPSATGTPPHIRGLIAKAKAQLAVPYVGETAIEHQIELWATGYGDKRHLIDETTRGVKAGTANAPIATALCRSNIFVDTFGDSEKNRWGTPDREIVAKRKACPGCLKKAAAEGTES